MATNEKWKTLQAYYLPMLYTEFKVSCRAGVQYSSEDCSEFWFSSRDIDFTNWGQVTQICDSKQNHLWRTHRLLHVRRQAIMWINTTWYTNGTLMDNFQ